MADTTNLQLPLIAAAQAQKHITVNEALVRLDGLTQMRLISRTADVPATATDGATFGVPVAATGDWAARDGQIAIFSNGGWVFTNPVVGWRAYIVDEGSTAMFNGADWISGAVAASPFGAVSRFDLVEVSHIVDAGPSSTTGAFIPANSVVFGVTGRVIDAIDGTAGAFEVGVSASTNRYGSGIGTGAGSFVEGLTGTPMTYYSDTSLELTAIDGTFGGAGTIILAAHVLRMSPPT